MGSAKKCRVYSVLAERRRGNPPTDGTTQRTLDKHCKDSLQAAATPTGHKKAGDSSVYIRFAGGGTLVIVDRRLLARTGASPDGQAEATC